MENLAKTNMNGMKQLGSLTLTETRLVNMFFVGFILYCLGFSMAASGVVNYIMCSSIQILGMMLFLPSAVLLVDFKVDNVYLRFLFYGYVLYLAFVIYRGFTLEYYGVRDLLIDGWFGIFIYFSPIVCLFPKKVGFLKKLQDSVKLFSVLFLFLVLAFAPFLIVRGGQQGMVLTEVLPRTLGLTAGFLLLTYPYHSFKVNSLSFGTLLVILLMATFQARRGLMMYCILIFFFAGLLYLTKGQNRAFLIVVLLMFFAAALLVGAEVLNKSSLFSTLMERGLEDTRSTVETCYFEDMDTRDWIIGKGLMGQYFCPGIDWEGSTVYRRVIETDYLQIILKGGIASLALLFLIMIPASFLGIFYSKNLLVKAFGIWIFIGLVNMYPSTVNTFTLNYLIMWIGVGICFTKEIRMMSDESLMRYLSIIKQK